MVGVQLFGVSMFELGVIVFSLLYVRSMALLENSTFLVYLVQELVDVFAKRIASVVTALVEPSHVREELRDHGMHDTEEAVSKLPPRLNLIRVSGVARSFLCLLIIGVAKLRNVAPSFASLAALIFLVISSSLPGFSESPPNFTHNLL